MSCNTFCEHTVDGSSEWFRRFKKVCREEYKLMNDGDIDKEAMKRASKAKSPAEVYQITQDHNETYFWNTVKTHEERIKKSIRGEEYSDDSDSDDSGYWSDTSSASVGPVVRRRKRPLQPRRSLRVVYNLLEKKDF